MITQELLDKISFKIIASSGEARSHFIEAMTLASNNDFASAQKAIEEGYLSQQKAYVYHYDLIENELNQKIPINMLVIHAEDTLSSTEIIKVMAENAIKQYRRLNALEKKIEVCT
ncbi:MAG TPA: PTS lactose/cellobiose transporter subunit IIA [Erysipelothrix sp.]